MQLIKEGAEPISSAKDISGSYPGFFERFTLKGSDATQKIPDIRLDDFEQKILGQLQKEPIGVDDLARAFGMPVSKLGVTLSMMQLRGLIKQEGGKYYAND